MNWVSFVQGFIMITKGGKHDSVWERGMKAVSDFGCRRLYFSAKILSLENYMKIWKILQ